MKILTIAAAVLVLAAPSFAQAASANVPVGDPIAQVNGPKVFVTAPAGEPVTLTAVGSSCVSSCYSWRNPDAGLVRYGGVILGYGPTVTVTPLGDGPSRVTLRHCVPTSARFVRCATTYVYITTTEVL